MVTRNTLLFMALQLILYAQILYADIHAIVDRKQIDITQTIELRIRVDDRISEADLNLTTLEKDWFIDNKSKSVNINLNTYRSNNSTTTTDIVLSLSPKRDGLLPIPSFSWRGVRTTEIIVEVTKLAKATKEILEKEIFISTSVSKDTAWVQEQILYKIELFYTTDIHLLRGMPATPILSGAIVKSLERPQTNIRVINGKSYHVISIKYAIFPQQEGTLVLPAERLPVYINPEARARNRKKIYLISSGHTIEVKPKASDYPLKQPWLPAENLSISLLWGDIKAPLNEPIQMQVGTPVARRIKISAKGLNAFLLPDLEFQHLDGAKIYNNPPQSTEKSTANGIISERVYSHSIIPSTPGLLNIPETRITWWSVHENLVREALIPAQSYMVEAATNPEGAVVSSRPPTPKVAEPPSTLNPDNQQQNKPPPSNWNAAAIWALSGFAFSGWLLAIIVWLLGKKKSQPRPKKESTWQQETKLFAKLRHACNKNDASSARAALINWLDSISPSSFKGMSLEDFVNLHDDSEGQQVLALLNAKLYRDNNLDWDGKMLFTWATNINKNRWWQQDKDKEAKNLIPLYPNHQ